MRIILASQSPRRADLLTELLDSECGEGVAAFEIDSPDIDESPLLKETPISYVQRLARAKACAVAERYSGNVLVVAADTTVDIDGKILGQPQDDRCAREMLSLLSGRSHRVHTAVCVIRLGDDGSIVAQAHGVDTAYVTMVAITEERLNWYLATGETEGKAGSYAIQGYGGELVERVEGSLTTVIGLPIDLLGKLLEQCDGGWKNRV